MKILILIIVFLIVFFLVLSIYYVNLDRRAAKKKNFLKKLGYERRKNSDRGAAGYNKTGIMEKAMNRLIDMALIESLLISADSNISVGRFLSISLGMGIFFILPPLLFMRNPFIMFLFLISGALLPSVYYIYRKNRREMTLVKQLPEAIDMITRSLKAGQSLDRALHEVSRRLPAPIGTEVSSVYDEITMGISFETAIKNLEDRYPKISDIKILCTTFVVQRETGGNLTKILDGLSKTIRDRFKLKMQVKALTAEGRTTSLILGLLPVAFIGITWLLNPKYVSILFVHPVGKKILMGALFLEVLGFYIMKKISDIKV